MSNISSIELNFSLINKAVTKIDENISMIAIIFTASSNNYVLSVNNRYPIYFTMNFYQNNQDEVVQVEPIFTITGDWVLQISSVPNDKRVILDKYIFHICSLDSRRVIDSLKLSEQYRVFEKKYERE
ncbi:hypothetical protein ACQCVK_10595 [Rossellomorea vietnamensis]|uniref:hypothetical protein n=1 Tax=Rossellomorea vietnamensis TaxID=218284 RepID=UPI003CF67744